MPPKSAKVDRTFFEDDIAAFEKANPNIDVVAHDAFPCQDPKTFDAKLAGGQMEDVFYIYFTDAKHVVDINQAADITPLRQGPQELRRPSSSQLRDIYTVDGKIYGVPRTNYSMGLLYNRKLFTQAGLDPDKPPATWEEVRAAAKKIAGLGNGNVGYADYSEQNQGGWHFTAEMYSLGGDVVTADGKKAAVNTAEGKAVLQNLKDMRWTDNSMGTKQLLILDDVQQMMGSGKLGMYVAAPDNIPILVKQKGGNYDDLGLAPDARRQGHPGRRRRLHVQQEGHARRRSRPGLKWLELDVPHPRRRLPRRLRRAPSRTTRPVGLPEPRLWTGAADAKDQAGQEAVRQRPGRELPALPRRQPEPGRSRSSRRTRSRSTRSSTAPCPRCSPRRTPTSTSS